MEYNIIDIAVLVPVIYGLVRGLMRGLVKELTSIAVVVVGFVITKLYAPRLALWLSTVVTWDAKLCEATAYITLFFATAIVLTLLSHLLSKFLQAVSLGFFNRLLGGVFGAAKWLLIASVVLNGVLLLNDHFSFIREDIIERSWSVRHVTKVAAVAWDEVSKDLNLNTYTTPTHNTDETPM